MAANMNFFVTCDFILDVLIVNAGIIVFINSSDK